MLDDDHLPLFWESPIRILLHLAMLWCEKEQDDLKSRLVRSPDLMVAVLAGLCARFPPRGAASVHFKSVVLSYSLCRSFYLRAESTMTPAYAC